MINKQTKLDSNVEEAIDEFGDDLSRLISRFPDIKQLVKQALNNKEDTDKIWTEKEIKYIKKIARLKSQILKEVLNEKSAQSKLNAIKKVVGSIPNNEHTVDTREIKQIIGENNIE